jgi:hypothetical protein
MTGLLYWILILLLSCITQFIFSQDIYSDCSFSNQTSCEQSGCKWCDSNCVPLQTECPLLSEESNETSSSPKIVGFFHAACICSVENERTNWRIIIREIVDGFHKSPIHNITSHVFVTMSTPSYTVIQRESKQIFQRSNFEIQFPLQSNHQYQNQSHNQSHSLSLTEGFTFNIEEKFQNMFLNHTISQKYPKFVLALQSNIPALYEWPTISMLYQYCKFRPQDLVWYVHSKGARYPRGDGKTNSYSWRRYMQYFIFNRGPEWCVPPLRSGEKDICGVNWKRNHFSGNFWWSSCRYIVHKQHEPLTLLHGLKDRIKAEMWLGNNELPKPRVLCLHQATSLPKSRRRHGVLKRLDHYRETYPPFRYRNAPIGRSCNETVFYTY